MCIFIGRGLPVCYTYKVTPKRVGRPKTAAKHKRTIRVVILFTRDEHARLVELAKKADVPFAEFARARLLADS